MQMGGRCFITAVLGPSNGTIAFIALSQGSLHSAVVASEHYLLSHIWGHIIKKHLFRVYLWTFGALFYVHWGQHFLPLGYDEVWTK